MRRRFDPPRPRAPVRDRAPPLPGDGCLRSLHMAGYMMYGMGLPRPAGQLDLLDGWDEAKRNAESYQSVNVG